VPGALSYQVVRSDLANLKEARDFIDMGAVICVQSNSTSPGTTGHEDPEVPELGAVFFYVASYNDGQDSSYGSASANKPRAAASGGCQ